MTLDAPLEIRVRPRPHCYLCGRPGQAFHQGLADLAFGVPGRWHLKRCPDTHCGLAWLDPMPLEEDIGLAYRDYHTHGRGSIRQRSGGVYAVYRYLRRGYLAAAWGYGGVGVVQRGLGGWLRLAPPVAGNIAWNLRYLRAQPGGRLLDVGCGDGAYLALMEELGWHGEGQEVDPAAARRAKERGLTVHLGPLRELGLVESSYHAITLCHVLEHVHDPLGLLVECRRLLRPGGILVLSLPNLDSAGHRRFGPAWRGLEPPRHIHLFTPSSLRTLVERAGFQVRSRTSARLAAGMYQLSARQRPAGPGLLLRPRAALFQLGETAAVGAGWAVGEELILEGVKP